MMYQLGHCPSTPTQGDSSLLCSQAEVESSTKGHGPSPPPLAYSDTPSSPLPQSFAKCTPIASYPLGPQAPCLDVADIVGRPPTEKRGVFLCVEFQVEEAGSEIPSVSWNTEVQGGNQLRNMFENHGFERFRGTEGNASSGTSGSENNSTRKLDPFHLK